jgi:DNA-binding response OmpR family regulator
MAEKMRVLIVHSDQQTLMGLEQALEDCGLSATTTWDAGEAAHLLRARRFDLVVVGDRPPAVSASELLAVARSSNGNARCVVLKADKYFVPACRALVENRLKRAS